MTILIDEAIWPWRGERWAHLVSDHSIAELHDFSRTLQVRRLSFSGDHYDVTAAARLRALGLGARPADAREIVKRLRAAGLRRRNVGHWREVSAVPAGELLTQLDALLDGDPPADVIEGAELIVAAGPVSDARIAKRGDEVAAAVVTRRETAGVVGDGFELRVTPHDDAWFTELVADRTLGAPIA